AAVREPHARDLAQRRVRLLGRVSRDADAHTPALRTLHQVARLDLLLLLSPSLADELLDGRHLSRLPRESLVHDFCRYESAQTRPRPSAGRRPGIRTPLRGSPAGHDLRADPCTAGTAPSGLISDQRPPLGRRRIIIGKPLESNEPRTRQ